MTAFTGPRAQVEAWLASRAARHYVYVLHRPDGTPFYIGKGTGRRVFDHELEARRAHPVGESNPYKCNVIRSIELAGQAVVYTIDSAFDDELAAYAREAVLIAQYRRLHEGGTLTNLAPGGGTAMGPAPLTRTRHANTLAGSPPTIRSAPRSTPFSRPSARWRACRSNPSSRSAAFCRPRRIRSRATRLCAIPMR